jgi:hypothetical protein
MLLFTPVLVDSLEFDNLKGDLIIDETTSDYGKITIYNWNVIGKLFDIKLIELELKENTDVCGSACSMETEIIMYKDGILIDDIKFMKLIDEDWIEKDIESYQFYIKTGEKDVDTYGLVPNIKHINGTFKFEQGVIGIHKESIWEVYNLGDEVKSGTYLIRLEGRKRTIDTIDWQITTQGKLLDDWAEWSAGSKGLQENYNGAIDTNGMTTHTDIMMAQTFTIGTVGDNSAYDIFKIGLQAQKAGTPGTCYISIVGTTSTVPNFTVYSYGTYSGTDHTATAHPGDWVNITMIQNYTVVPSRMYGIWMNCTGDVGNFVAYETKIADVYAGGIFYRTTAGASLPWNDIRNTSEFAFEVYGVLAGGSVTLDSPATGTTIYEHNQNFNCTATQSGVNIWKIEFWENKTGSWLLNETEYFINDSVSETSSFNKNITQGTFGWTCRAYDDDEDSAWADSNRTFTVDIPSPNITITTPANNTNTTNNNLNINYTTDGASYCWYSNDTFAVNTTLICGTNITDITWSDGEHDVIIWANNSAGDENSSSVRFTIDTIFPVITINLPITLLDFGYQDKAEDLNWSIIESNIDSIWYVYNNSNTTTSGLINSSTFAIQEDVYNITLWANDSFGNINSSRVNWTYTLFMTNESYPHSILEGTSGSFYINVTNAQATLTPYLIYNDTSYLGSCDQTGDDYVCSKDINIHIVNLDINHTFYWSFLMADSSIINSTSYGVAVQNFAIDNCTLNSILIMNLTLKEETNYTVLENATNIIEVDLAIKNSIGTEIASYNNTWNGKSNVTICINDTLTTENYKLDLTSSFTSGEFVTEFYHIDEGNLNASVIPIEVDLVDLLTTDSTSFLFNYFDEDGLSVDNIIIHVFRKYIGEGLFREVERSKQNIEGDTIVHLVEEDVIYYFKVSLNSTYLFTSGTYNALCDTTPCTIILQEGGAFQEFDDDWDLVEGGVYTMYANSVTREVNLTFVTDEASTFNLTVYKIDSSGDYEVVGSDEETGVSGSVSVIVPLISGNVSFFAVVREDDEFINSRWIDWDNRASSYFGDVLAIFLASLIILSLGLMAISDGGSVTIVFILLGLVLTSILGLIKFTADTGLGILIYFILTGGILIWKLTKKNR